MRNVKAVAHTENYHPTPQFPSTQWSYVASLNPMFDLTLTTLIASFPDVAGR